ncbi:MAG: ParB/RepB/Spo0J family partition protein [Desulfobacterales bacterium]|nr:ParB/RepB/Spo0J family partition protein [Desulfobacterales bacterium]
MLKAKQKKESDSNLKKRKKMALGRGIDALIPDLGPFENDQVDYFQCDINLIHPNRYQPRIIFSREELEELCSSIKELGIIQPVLLRKDGSGYELVAGERRFRAAKMAGLTHVPAFIKNITDSDLLEMSIVENIQREDLNALEEAEAFQQLITEFNLTQEQVAKRVGKSRSAVANLLRLRQLPEQIKASILDHTLSMGHARALLGADTSAQQNAAWRAVVLKKLSVRETEALINRLKSEKKKPWKSSPDSEQIYLSSLADDLSRHLGTKTQIKRHGKKGKILIEFSNNEDLDRLIDLLKQL